MQLLYSRTYPYYVTVNLLYSQSNSIITYSRASLIWAVWNQYFFLFCALYSAEQRAYLYYLGTLQTINTYIESRSNCL